jgi:hypothetical protein
MQLNYKLALLELIGGLFGWVWILASLAALYFLAMALFAGGSWWRFLAAMGTAAIGKWLLSGFEENKRRVAFEAALVAGGGELLGCLRWGAKTPHRCEGSAE